MCPSRHWKQLETLEFDNTVNIIGTRSDGLIVTSQAVFESKSTVHEIIKSVVSAMKRLESFRNCQCTSDERCEKHKIQQSQLKKEQLNGADNITTK